MQELHRQRPHNAPTSTLKVLGGANLALAFKGKYVAQISGLKQIGLRAPAAALQTVLVALAFAGEADEVFEEFKAMIMSLP